MKKHISGYKIYENNPDMRLIREVQDKETAIQYYRDIKKKYPSLSFILTVLYEEEVTWGL